MQTAWSTSLTRGRTLPSIERFSKAWKRDSAQLRVRQREWREVIWKKELSDTRKCPVCHGEELGLWRDFEQLAKPCHFPVLPSLLGFCTSTCHQPSEHTEVINDLRDHPENIPGSCKPQDTARNLLLWQHLGQKCAPPPFVELSCSFNHTSSGTSLPACVVAAEIRGYKGHFYFLHFELRLTTSVK